MKVRLEPRPSGTGYRFTNESPNDRVPGEFVKSADHGIQEVMMAGILAAKEVVEVHAGLCDGSFHRGDSHDMAFQIAGATAFKEAARKASPVVLEPVMQIEVVASEEFVGPIMGELSKRRARIEVVEHRFDSQAIQAAGPLAELLGFVAGLRAPTRGRI